MKMALVPHKITALAESDEQGTDGKNIVAGAIVVLYDTSGEAAVLYDDENGANGSTVKQTDAKGQIVVYVTPGEYDEQVNGSVRRRVAIGGNSVVSYGTTAELQASRPNKTGQRAENRERANAQYTLAAEGYTALAGDVVAANGRVWELQLDGEVVIEYFGGNNNGSSYNNSAFSDLHSRSSRWDLLDGVYVFNESPIISKDFSLTHKGVSDTCSIRQDTAAENVLTIDGGGSFIRVSISGVTLSHNATITSASSGYTLYMKDCVASSLNGLSLYNFDRGLYIENVARTFINKVTWIIGLRSPRFALMTSGNSLGKSTGIHCTDLEMSANANYVCNRAIHLECVDGFYMTNSHFDGADKSILFQPIGETNKNSVYSVKFSSCYFDGVDGVAGSTQKLEINEVVSTVNNNIVDVYFQDCEFSRGQNRFLFAAALDATTTLKRLKFDGGVIQEIAGALFIFSDDTCDGFTCENMDIYDDDGRTTDNVDGFVIRGRNNRISNNTIVGNWTNSGGSIINVLGTAVNTQINDNIFDAPITVKVANSGTNTSESNNI